MSFTQVIVWVEGYLQKYNQIMLPQGVYRPALKIVFPKLEMIRYLSVENSCDPLTGAKKLHWRRRITKPSAEQFNTPLEGKSFKKEYKRQW